MPHECKPVKLIRKPRSTVLNSLLDPLECDGYEQFPDCFASPPNLLGMPHEFSPVRIIRKPRSIVLDSLPDPLGYGCGRQFPDCFASSPNLLGMPHECKPVKLIRKPRSTVLDSLPDPLGYDRCSYRLTHNWILLQPALDIFPVSCPVLSRNRSHRILL